MEKYRPIILVWIFVLCCTSSKAFPDPSPIRPEEKSLGGTSPLANVQQLNSTFRLSDALIPSEYSVTLRPLLDAPEEGFDRFTAPGTVLIKFSVTTAVSQITLHSRRLEITRETIKVRQGANDIPVVDSVYTVENDTFTINLGSALAIGDGEVEMSYVALMDGLDGLNGIYRAYYTVPGDATGKIHDVAATHMEPTRARKVFPCFDEPGLKAIFRITLGRRSNYTTLSNTEIEKTEEGSTPGWWWDHYKPTPAMSTYLFAAVVSDFASKTAPEGIFDKPVDIWAAPHYIRDGAADYAAETAAKTIKFLQDEFKVPYILEKIDSAAIPQFSPGAMENWGLNLYRENLLLRFEGITSEAERHSVANVIAHELVHQWFGNVVTCKWWSDIWLNEGFATHLSYVVERITAPEMESEQRFYLDSTVTALRSDVLASTHPIHNPSEETVNVSPLFFTDIAYEKAGAVIRMFEGVVGQSRFHQALTHYLKGMDLQAAHQDDLFRLLQDNLTDIMPTDLTVKDFFDTWTLKSGFPLLRLSSISNNILSVAQERYVAITGEEDNPGNEPINEFWHVPVFLQQLDDGGTPFAAKTQWLRPKQLSVITRDLDLTRAVLVNAGPFGLYRTLYDRPLYDLIHTELRTKRESLHPIFRAQLIDDYFHFLKDGYTSDLTGAAMAMTPTKYLSEETTLAVWDVALGHFRSLRERLLEYNSTGTALPAREKLEEYILQRVDAALIKLGWDWDVQDKTGATATLASRLIDWSCSLGASDSDCVTNAALKFDEWVNTPENPSVPESITGDIQATVYCTALGKADETDLEKRFTFLIEKYDKESNPVHKTRLLNALACAPRKSLEEVQNVNGRIADADKLTLLNRIVAVQAGTPDGVKHVINLFEANFNQGALFSPQNYASVLNTASNYLVSQSDIAAIQAFREENSGALAPVSGSIDAAITKIYNNIDWNERVGLYVAEWIRDHA